MSDNKYTPAQVIHLYITTRDTMKVIADKHAEELKPFQDKLALCEAWLLKYLQDGGIQNVKSDYATAYMATREQVKIGDLSKFWAFILDGRHPHMLNQAPNKTAVKEWLEKHGELPPGIEMTEFHAVNVRRS